jgi:hypothetical protein
MKKLLFVALVSGVALVACKGGDKNGDANKVADSIAAKKHMDSLQNAANMIKQQDAPKDTTKKAAADTTKK